MKTKIIMKPTNLLTVLLLCTFIGFSQVKKEEKKQEDKKENKQVNNDADKFKPLLLKLNDSGSKYLRFIFHGQVQSGMTNIGDENSRLKFDLARARIIAIGQFSPRFLMLWQIGTHALSANGASAFGKGSADLFFNDFIGEYMLFDQKLYLGAGLHYWGGISRLGRSSTQKFLTLDSPNPRAGWYKAGRTGQFVREFGVYLKGNVNKKFQWAATINDAQTNYAEAPTATLSNTTSIYGGAQLLPNVNSEKARLDYTARVEYQFFDIEGDKFPFKKGGAINRKGHLLNLGAGAFYHPSAAILLKPGSTAKTFADLQALKSLEDINNNVTFENAVHVAVDVYYENKGFSLYALYQNTDYGKNAIKFGRYTGSNMVFTAGYVLPNNGKKITYSPYIGYNILNPDIIGTTSGYELKAGVNLLHIGNFMKTTFEYQRNKWINNSDATNNFLIQMQFIL